GVGTDRDRHSPRLCGDKPDGDGARASAARRPRAGDRAGDTAVLRPVCRPHRLCLRRVQRTQGVLRHAGPWRAGRRHRMALDRDGRPCVSGFRQSQSSLHTWSGLIVGWVLFTIFLMGTVSYWRADLNRWMRPELSGPSQPEQAVAGAQAYLRRTAPDARSWFISVPGAHE